MAPRPIPLSARTLLAAALTVALLVPSAGDTLAQRRPQAKAAGPVPMEAVEFTTWFEADKGGVDLEDGVASLLRSVLVQPNAKPQDGFFNPLPFDLEQLGAEAELFGPAGTLQAWVELFCQNPDDFEPLESLKGKLRIQVWTEDPATGWLSRLTKIKANADTGSAFGESAIKLDKLNGTRTLHFQLLSDRVSPVKEGYCYFAYGVYRKFVGGADED